MSETIPGVLIPHSFQVPNGVVDCLEPLLDGEEFKIVIYLCRRTFGFQKRRDRISLGQFAGGVRGADGRVLDGGTGLNRALVSARLGELRKFGVVVETQPGTRVLATEYALQTDLSLIDLEGLEQRREAARKQGEARTRKGRAARQKAAMVGATDQPLVREMDQGLVGVTNQGWSGGQAGGGLPDRAGVVCGTDPHELRGNPGETQSGNPGVVAGLEAAERSYYAAARLFHQHEAAFFEFFNTIPTREQAEAIIRTFEMHALAGRTIDTAVIRRTVDGAMRWSEQHVNGRRTVNILLQELGQVVNPLPTPTQRQRERERRATEASRQAERAQAARRSPTRVSPEARPLWETLRSAADGTSRGFLEVAAAVSVRSGSDGAALCVELDNSAALEWLRRREGSLWEKARSMVPAFPAVEFRGGPGG